MTDHTVNRTNRQEGRQEILVGQVCKKLRRQKSVPEIAEALEEDEAVIQCISFRKTSLVPIVDLHYTVSDRSYNIYFP